MYPKQSKKEKKKREGKEKRRKGKERHSGDDFTVV